MRDGNLMPGEDFREIELVVFDCDGVLVDSEYLAAEAMMGVLRAGGVPVELPSILKGIGKKAADIIAGIEADIGESIDPALLTQLWPATEALFGERLQPTPGVASFIGALPTARCVASSSHHARIAFSLETTGLGGFFPPGTVFSASEVARGKPAPDLVEHAARRMGVAPARCLVVEDSRFGVAGAVAAGALAVGYIGGCHASEVTRAELDAAGAAFTVSSWEELSRRLALYRLVPAGSSIKAAIEEG